MLAVGLLRFINAIIGSLGGLLLFFGIFTMAANGDYLWVAWGVALIVASEATGLYLARYDSQKQRDSFIASFWGTLGAYYALPVLFFLLYLSGPDKFMLVFTLSITSGAVIKTAAMLARMMFIERAGA